MHSLSAILAITAAALPTAVAAGNSTASSNNTVNLFINERSDQALAWAGSIVEACSNATVYAVTATSAADSALTGANAPVVTFTENRAVYFATYTINETLGDKTVGAWAQESCGLQDTTAAVCETMQYTTVSGSVITASIVPKTIQGSGYHRYNVTITSGAEKTLSPTGVCAPTAAPTSTTSGTGRGPVTLSGIMAVIVGLVVVVIAI